MSFALDMFKQSERLVLVVSFYICYITFETIATCDQDVQVSNSHFQQKLVPYTFDEPQVYGLHGCVHACFDSGEGCKAFNFNRKTNKCELKYKGIASTVSSDFQPDGDYIFSDITEWPKSLASGCSNHDCEDSQLCVPSGKNDFRCVAKDCGKLEGIPYGSVSAPITTHGSVAVYTCVTTYQITFGDSKKTCYNGVWKGIEAKCSPIPNIGCYYPGSSQSYKGTASTTWNGKACQRWDEQTPHSHDMDMTLDFPDTSLSAAENYCRNPDYDGNKPWCYTMDPGERWTACEIIRC